MACFKHQGALALFSLAIWSCASKAAEPADETAAVTCVERSGEQVCFQTHGEYAIVEGDIIIGRTKDILAGGSIAEARLAPATLQPQSFPQLGKGLWEGKRIPYLIEPGFTSNAEIQIKGAIANWESAAGFKFVRLVTGENVKDPIKDGELVSPGGELTLPPHLTFHPDSTLSGSCNSWIGCQGGAQYINLPPDASGCIVHEIGHAIGLAHEQSRPDRDNYIVIHIENVEPGMEHNFPKRSGDTSTPYDFGSVMHYSSDAFSINGKPTITTKAGGLIPYNQWLSLTDVAGANILYGIR